MSQNPINVLELAMEVALPKGLLDAISVKFGPEKARECAMSTSVGGIGPLLRERILQQADQNLKVVGVSLLFETVWVQTWKSHRQIQLQKRQVGFELRQFLKPTRLNFQLNNFDGTPLEVSVWELDMGKAKVYFLSVPDICTTVYPGSKDAPKEAKNANLWAHNCRFGQSWLLGRGALMLAKKLNFRPDIINLSETPTFFAHHKLVKDDLQSDPFFDNTKYIFNDHTPLEYAHPVWDMDTIEAARLDPTVFQKYPAWKPGKKSLDVTAFLVGCCEGVFGVAQKHGEVMREMPSLKPYLSKIQAITNGVRVQEWRAPEFANWPNMPDEALLKAKNHRKKILLQTIAGTNSLGADWVAQNENRQILLLTRRITGYKRLDVFVKLISQLSTRKRLLKLNTLLLVGGRVHQQDNQARELVQDLLESIQKDQTLSKRVIFIDNFNVLDAPKLYHGCDATIMLSDDTREASATGFMKGQVNGAASLANPDGAVPEYVRFYTRGAQKRRPSSSHDGVPTEPNGFMIPYDKGEPTPSGLIEAIEHFCELADQPGERLKMMKASFAMTPHISLERAVNEMKMLYNHILSQRLYTSPSK